jgi:hypothetical protein
MWVNSSIPRYDQSGKPYVQEKYFIIPNYFIKYYKIAVGIAPGDQVLAGKLGK